MTSFIWLSYWIFESGGDKPTDDICRIPMIAVWSYVVYVLLYLDNAVKPLNFDAITLIAFSYTKLY